jgi:hypothetical protein
MIRMRCTVCDKTFEAKTEDDHLCSPPCQECYSVACAEAAERLLQFGSEAEPSWLIKPPLEERMMYLQELIQGVHYEEEPLAWVRGDIWTTVAEHREQEQRRKRWEREEAGDARQVEQLDDEDPGDARQVEQLDDEDAGDDADAEQLDDDGRP